MTDQIDPAAKADELSRIEAKMVTLIDAALSSGRPYLLSELGLALGNDLRVLKGSSGQRLIEFIRDRLPPRFSLVRLGAHGNVHALIPASTEVTSSQDGDEGRASAAEDMPHKEERYHYRFWAAFAVPLVSEVRHLDRRSLTFVDTSLGEPVPEGALLIRADMIPPADIENRDRAISQNITKWLAENGLSADEFWASTRAQPRVTTVASPKTGISILEHLLDCLDGRQLHSTSLTLDVVRALLRKHV